MVPYSAVRCGVPYVLPSAPAGSALQEHSISTMRNACLMAGLEVGSDVVKRVDVSILDCGALPTPITC